MAYQGVSQTLIDRLLASLEKNKDTRKIPMPMIDADGCLLNVSVEGREAGRP